MTGQNQYAKDYLSQARYINQRIQSKVDQLKSLREMTTSASAALTGMPRNPNPSGFDDFIASALELEEEINQDLQGLVALKRDIVGVIKQVADKDCQTLLELRYLCYKTWELIAIDMYFNVRWTHQIHGKALQEVDAILRNRQ